MFEGFPATLVRSLATAAAAVAIAAAAAAPASATPSTRADFNGDGFSDLAVGAPTESAAAVSDGGVNVIYGSAGGLSATAVPDQLLGQDSPSVEGVAETGDKFGSSLAAGDFNADGRSDLAIGVPFEDGSGIDDGGVSVIYGSAGGLSATAIPDQFLGQDSPNVEGTAEDRDKFGSSLAARDFNNDGFSDLVIGVPFEDAGATDDGGVSVIYGSATGLSPTAVPDQFLGQDSPGVEGTAEGGDRFGDSLAAGDVNGDGRSDVIVGVPFEDASGSDDGGVAVIYGSASGLSATAVPDQFLGQDSPNVEGTAESGDKLGDSVTTRDFNNDGFSDVAAGVPFEDASGTDDGGVNVIYGSANGLSPTGVADQFLGQDSPNVEGAAETVDRFGTSVAGADFNADGFADLAIGVPDEDTSASGDGGVNVIYGSAGGLSATAVSDQLLGQDSPGVEGTAEDGDAFGGVLTAADFNGDGRADLATGVPLENASGVDDGGVSVIYGSPAGLSATATPDQFLGQDSPNVEGTAESADQLGSSLAAQ